AVQPITVTDGAGPVAGAAISLVLDDQNLASGSTPAGPDFAANSISFTAGSDAIASIVFATDLALLGGGLSWTRLSDTQIVGKDGAATIVTLDLSVAGSVATVTATLNGNYDSHPGLNADDLAALGSVGVVATDSDGTTAIGTVNVAVSDDVPDAVDDAGLAVAEDAAGTIGGNLLTNDTQGADGATLTHVQLPGSGAMVALTTGVLVGGAYQFTTALGVYNFQANGAWSFDPAPGQANAAGISAGFSYRITDGDGDTDTAVQPITVTDGAGPVAGAAISLVLDDQNLASGSTPAGPDFAANSISFTAGSDAIASIVFATDLALLG
ncbi:Ig-like domain-containing protein, partial [Bosea sp. LC85]|uniref:Ig-like domain-containing protein n=1 Tax=Bosea sp. LC85 TaxID=1502851 RepID=UPI0005B7B631